MHVPDGFLDVTTSIGTGLLSAGVVAVALRRCEHELRDTGAPLAGLTAVFVFAAQMVNFPVGAGTSGHLLGGALAAILVGPWTAVLCLTVVLGVQALFFADGGLTAIGTNILVMGVVTAVVGYLTAAAVLRLLGGRRSGVVPAAFLGGLVSVPMAAAVFVALYAVGGAVAIPLPTLTTVMLGWHLLIGVGEGLITAAVVAALVATRPDLVFLTRARVSTVLLGADGTPVEVAQPALAPTRRFVGVATAVCLLVAGGLSLVASGHPDGLEYVASRLGFDGMASPSHGVFADYRAVLDGSAGTVLAGVIGVLLVGLAMTLLLRARRSRPAVSARL